jgi:uncharacterized protein (DUF1778 family)
MTKSRARNISFDVNVNPLPYLMWQFDTSIERAQAMPASKLKKVSTSSKDRMHFRLAPEIKERVTRAAAITGQGLTDFAIAALSERADEVLERHESVLLNRKDYHFFLTSLDNVHKPSRRSRTAAARYRRGSRKGVRYRFAD